jgi:transposase InsO family protein
VDTFKSLEDKSLHMSRSQLIEESSFSKSQFYIWLNGIDERKKRTRKLIPEPVAESTVKLILRYPHFSASKGQAYMIYHQLGYIPQHIYKMLKNIVKRIIFQMVSARKLLPERTLYEHERPNKPGEIWVEDFTRIKVSGITFYVSLLIDVASNYYLGATASNRADAKLVEIPVLQALEANNGCGPKRFLLSDNGTPYISDDHGRLLDKLEIVQKRIPSCTPEYNGSCECGVKEFKNVFYNVWAEMEIQADKGKRLLERVQAAVLESTKRLNHEIPRPCLKGVTSNDVQKGVAKQQIERNRKYFEQEQQRKEVKPWTKSTWNLVKDILFEKGLSDLELMTKFCFFLKRPLRKLPDLSLEVLGN